MLGWVTLLFRRSLVGPSASTVAAITGSVMPDFLNGLYIVSRHRLIKWNHSINLWAHTALIKKPLPARQGFLVQAIFFAVLALYLWR